MAPNVTLRPTLSLLARRPPRPLRPDKAPPPTCTVIARSCHIDGFEVLTEVRTALGAGTAKHQVLRFCCNTQTRPTGLVYPQTAKS